MAAVQKAEINNMIHVGEKMETEGEDKKERRKRRAAKGLEMEKGLLGRA